MRIYCALPFGEAITLQEHFHTTRPAAFLPAHMVYRIRGTRLYYASGSSNIHDGVMVIGTSGYTGGGPMEGLLDDIAHEIKKRGFEGVVLDNGGDISPIHTTFAARIVSALRPFPVYLPAQLAAIVKGGVALVQTALSGGSLERHLAAAIELHGAPYVAVECDRICMDFTLPAKNGIGESIGTQQLQNLLSASGRSFYSDELHVNYFTYKSGAERHMVLYDDANSIRQKLNLAERMSITRTFVYYPNTFDIITQLR